MRDLNDLSFFAAVVANGGFSAAARATGVPKSRISRRVAALEGQLGVRLVERSTRRFKVTEVGEEVYRHARAALTEAEAIDHVVARLTAEPQGLVRISCPLDADRIVGAALPEFLARHPRLRVQVIVTNRRIDLVEENVDIAIRVRETLDTDPDLQLRIIARVGSLLVASPGFLDAHGEPATPAEIAALPTLGHTDRPGVERWTLVNPAGEEATVLHEPRLSASTFPILRQAAIDSVGLALLPELSCREALEDGRLVRILPDWGSRQGVLHLVFTAGRAQLPGVRAVIEFAAEALRPCGATWEIDI
ncbi:LysR substrate-binding domain-containing protein [Phenylobacterium sp. LjRoot225]|uniref:LysR substrate-binding domain-containing protein n=1 Tax=Phenylobacterium sp. LjRoot225 TaxID=3342285 RepID=UPI003ED10103